MHAAVYVRVSTTSQSAPDKVSPERQRQECCALAGCDGFAVTEDHIFHEAISGAAPDRPAFNDMLRTAKAGQFSRLYVWSQDRLSRSGMLGTLTALEELRNAGVAVFSVQEGELKDELLPGIRGWMAGEERKRITERTAPAKRKKRDAGYWVSGTIPHGFVRGPNMTLRVEPNTGTTIKQIFDWCIEGHGRIWIARRLNEQNLPPPFIHIRVPGREKTKRLRSSDFDGRWEKIEAWMVANEASFARGTRPMWDPDNIHHLTKKTIYMGELHGNPMLIDPAPVVDRRTFAAASQAIKGRYMKGAGVRQEKLLRGMIKCASCERAYIYHMGSRDRHYYICRGRRAGNGCTAPNLHMADTHNEVIKVVGRYLFDRLSLTDFEEFLVHTAGRKQSELQSELTSVQARMRHLQSQRDELTTALWYAVKDGIDEDALPGITGPLRTVTNEYEEVSRKERYLIEDITRHSSDFSNAERLAMKAAEEAFDSVLLREFGTAEPTSVEVRAVLRILSVNCKVQTNKTLEIEFDQSDESLSAVIRYLAHQAMDRAETHDVTMKLLASVHGSVAL